MEGAVTSSAAVRARVLILDAAVGGGHRSVADAIEEALVARFAERVSVHRADIYAAARWPAGRAGALYDLSTVRYPLLWRLAYHTTDRRLAGVWRGLASFVLGPSLRRCLVAVRPDLVVSTAPVVGPALSAARAAAGQRWPWLMVVTDLGHVHATWFAPGVDTYVVPSAETYDACRARGLAARGVRYTGLPVRQAFRRAMGDQRALRAKLGWPVDQPTALVLSGAGGAGPIAELVQRTAVAAPRVHQVVVCGRNERLRQRVAARQLRGVTVYGFVQNVADLMAAADLVATKAGAVTTVECLVAGRPLVVTSALPGQEEANARHLAQHGAARVAVGVEQAARAVVRLASDPSARAHLVARGRPLAAVHANAADAVVDLIGFRLHLGPS
jgi:1,2-diacylglycerol 3-beta-galactosyltransferase